ncbi:glycosyltransferase family 87 protein [Leptolyngbya sp. FACHB-17]|uniref:glycosyltransferase family 87 protein n=1 Tax=Leptolyngbya sp. FACHB-17 TaxID=2692803 RepID=UPI0016808BEC|nr:glycosyltransferase family 87 protein [Leptolyngbya sp. FACHB-17]MBD2080983.1 DUF2029 domain-containing protein [Leptolyngbya sp. FACHB-17]
MRIKLARPTSNTLRIELIFVSLLFIAFLFLVRKYQQYDISIYYDYSLNLLKGQFPYTDFNFEYPPLALLPIALPQLPSVVQPLNFTAYAILLFIQNAFFSHLIAVVLSRIIAAWQTKKAAIRTISFYAALIVPNLIVVFCRYDIFAALLTVIAFWAVLKQRPTQAGIWLGLGIAAKLYPVALIPIFSIYYFTKRQYQASAKFLLGNILTVAVIFLPFALAAQEKFFSFLTYHRQRGLHIETLPGGILLLLSKFGFIDASFELNYGAFHFTSEIATPILKVLPILTWSLLGITLFYCVKGFRQEYVASGEITYRTLATYITITLLVFMITAKVFSPQYLVWVLPFLPLLRLNRITIAFITAISVTTFLVYPVLYGRLLNLRIIALFVLNIRNVLIAAFAAYLLVDQSRNLSREAKKTSVEKAFTAQ